MKGCPDCEKRESKDVDRWLAWHRRTENADEFPGPVPAADPLPEIRP